MQGRRGTKNAEVAKGLLGSLEEIPIDTKLTYHSPYRADLQVFAAPIRGYGGTASYGIVPLSVGAFAFAGDLQTAEA